MKIIRSVNNEKNPVGNTGEFFIVHHTGSSAPDENQTKHLNNDDYVSCHFGIDRRGRIIALMDTDRIAYHCGVSTWKGSEAKNKKVFNPYTGESFFLSGMNPISLGVEIYSDGENFTKSQQKSCEKLLAWWCVKSGKPVQNILRHADIAPSRKWDIGPNFYTKKYGSWSGFQDAVKKRIEMIKRHFDTVDESIEIVYKKSN